MFRLKKSGAAEHSPRERKPTGEEWQSLERGEKMDIRVGDVVRLKKPHPCGASQWEVLRIGQDFRLKCLGCGHQLMVKRSLVEKNLRELTRSGEAEARLSGTGGTARTSSGLKGREQREPG